MHRFKKNSAVSLLDSLKMFAIHKIDF